MSPLLYWCFHNTSQNGLFLEDLLHSSPVKLKLMNVNCCSRSELIPKMNIIAYHEATNTIEDLEKNNKHHIKIGKQLYIILII